MGEASLSRLFRLQDVQALASRIGDSRWHVLHSPTFRKAIEDLDRRRISGEANTREKIIEPVLYEVLGFRREENDTEHAIRHAGAGGATGAVEYFFRLDGTSVPMEAEAWKKSLDTRDSSGRSPVRQGFDYAVLSNLRWFVVTSGAEWRLYKTQLKGSESPLGACERYELTELVVDRNVFARFCATFERDAFLADGEGLSRLDRLRQENEGWQLAIGEGLYDKLVDSRVLLYRAVQSRLPAVAQADVNDAVVKLLFRIMFILFAEHTPLLPREFLVREVVGRFESDRKWGRGPALYQYVQRYFAWLDGRDPNEFGIYPYDGALFDPDPILDCGDLELDDGLLSGILGRLSREALGRSIDYSQINPRILGNIYERFLGYVIEVKQGRLDPQVQRDTRRREGSFYTPESVTKYLVEHAVDTALRAAPQRQPWELRCLDPACGSGHFLVEYVNYVAGLSEERDDSRSYPQWKRFITEHCVFGVDKDRTAVMLTKLSLWINSAMEREPFATIDTHVKCGNSLVCGTQPGFRLGDSEKRKYPAKYRELMRLRKELAELERRADRGRPLLGVAESLELHREVRQAFQRLEDAKAPICERLTGELRGRWPCLAGAAPLHWEAEFAEVFEEQEGFDVIVGNPPWGADLRDVREYLEGGAYQLARGQYDSYELFVELARRLLHERGVFGFIVPDSITLPEHEPLRRMLVDHTTLTRLVRAGEGLFPSVFRGAFLISFVNRPAPRDHLVRVATLRKEDRKQLEQDTFFEQIRTISEIADQAGHDRPQSEFGANRHAEFDILATDQDRMITELIERGRLDWRQITETGRGVELGKKGEVLQCPFCYTWDTMPARSKGTYTAKQCIHCHREYTVERAAKREVIVAERRKDRNWRPLLVGESINRYFVSKRLWIDVTKEGINYKPQSFYRGDRLLVRKTGVGLMATIDKSGAYTNQVVFTWKLRGNLAPPLSHYGLGYLLGALNSRLMLYRLCTSSGETEWRSFPYVTQKTIQQLPVRAIDFTNAREKSLHDAIAARVEATIAKGEPPTDREDYEIELLVMQLYGITKGMCRRIFEVLRGMHRLRVFREMNIAEPDMLLDALSD